MKRLTKRARRAIRVAANVAVALAFTWYTVVPATQAPGTTYPGVPYTGQHMNTR